MAGTDLETIVRALHPETLAGLDRALTRGTATLVARVGDGERALVGQIDRQHIVLDATLYPSRAAIRMELLRNVVATLVGGDPVSLLADPTPSGDRGRLALAEGYGTHAGGVMRLLGASTTPALGELALSLPEIVAPAPVENALIIIDAHRMDTDARWDLRELNRPLVLVTRPGHVDSLVSSDAAFYGQAQTIAIRTPAAADWGRALSALDVPIHPSDLDWLLLRSRSRVATTYEALGRVSPRDSARSAWHRAVQDSIPRAHDALSLSGAVHAFAPRLLSAIAQGQRPYPVIPEASNQRVALALRKMHAVDLLEQPRPHEWQVADPLLQGALISILNRDRVRALRDDLTEEWAPGNI